MKIICKVALVGFLGNCHFPSLSSLTAVIAVHPKLEMTDCQEVNLFLQLGHEHMTQFWQLEQEEKSTGGGAKKKLLN